MFRHLGLCLAAAAVLCLNAISLAQDATAPKPDLTVANIFKIGGAGGWDYVKLDDAGQLLYVTRQIHTQVIDTSTGNVVADIKDNQGSHGVALAPAAGRGFISNGRGAFVTVFDLKTNKTLGKIKTDTDSDGIIFDPASNRVFVVCGDPGTMYAIDPNLDPATGKAEGPIDLGGKPEFLATDGQGKIFVNINDKNEMAVVDAKTLQVLNHWPLAPGEGPTGLAIDPAGHHLFSGCRGSNSLVVMSTDDGKVLANLPIGTGVDATAFYNGSALASCGDGTLTVARPDNSGNFAVAEVVKTAPGARTMAVDKQTGKIYLPTADVAAPTSAPTPAPTAGAPARPRRMRFVPNTFKILVVQPQ